MTPTNSKAVPTSNRSIDFPTTLTDDRHGTAELGLQQCGVCTSYDLTLYSDGSMTCHSCGSWCLEGMWIDSEEL